MFKNQYNFNNQSGQFRQRIQILQRQITQDSIGQNVEQDVDFGTYWAMVKTFVNRNQLNNDVEKTYEDRRFVIKYSRRLSDLLSTQDTIFHVRYKGNEYRVLEATNDNEQNKTLTIRVVDVK